MDTKKSETKGKKALAGSKPAQTVAGAVAASSLYSRPVKRSKLLPPTKVKQEKTIVAFYAQSVVQSPALPYLAAPSPDDEERWYTQLDAFLAKAADTSRKIPSAQLEEMCAAVELVYTKEADHYAEGKKSKKKSSDDKWFDDVIKSGTLSDRVAALALMVQESPPHQLTILDQLVAIATKKEQRPAQLALEALKDLLIHNLLPDRRLRRFRMAPLGSQHMTMKTALLLWYEEQLLVRVERIVSALEAGVKGSVEFFKKACMDVAAEWLSAKPEQESRLLSLLVHKLGDPSNGVCNKAIELLKGVVRAHPSMKGVLVREVRQLIYFQNTPPRALHNGILFLSSLTLTEADHEVALQLIDAYMGLFENVADKKEMKSRLLSILLTGVNRAFPFVKSVEPLQKHIDALFRIVHTASFSASTQALTLILYLAIGHTEAPAATEDSRGSTPEEDPAKVALISRYYRALYSKLLSDEFTSRTRNTMFLNLLYRSVKRDPSDLRCMAFVKRIFMSALQSAGAIAAGLLFLVSEIAAHRPFLVEMITKLEVEDCSGSEGAGDLGNGLEGDDGNEAETHKLGVFDGSKREPLFACLKTPSLWELSLLRSHFHPSVRAFSASLAADPHKIVYNGNPIAELSISAFLNRFAYKNPKKMDERKSSKASSAKKEEPLNSFAFINANASNIDADKKFFHKFFGDRDRLRMEGKSRNRSKKSRSGGYEGDAIEGDDDGEDMDDDDDDDETVGGGGDLEAEIDKYADKLAMDLMKSYTNGAGPDIDDEDEFSEDDLDDDEMESIGDDDNDGFHDVDDDESRDDGFDEVGEDSEEESGGYQLKEYGDDEVAGLDDDDDDAVDDNDDDDNDDDDYDDEEDVFSLMSRKNPSKRDRSGDRSEGQSIFADASEYEGLMEENAQKFSKRKKK